MKKNVIVSLADSNYFELLNELVDSIKSFEQSKDTAICILDAGLSEQQKNILSKKVDEIKSAEWDIDVPALNAGTSISHSADLISSTFFDNIFFCCSDKPASKIQIAVSLLFSKLLIESINSLSNSK